MMMVFILLLLLLVTFAPAHSQTLSLDCAPMDDETKEKARAIVLEALDQALKEHVQHMFSVWMRDEGPPARERARHGARKGLRGYIQARAMVLEWDCPSQPKKEN
jgi:hypothetical protein